MEDDDEDDAGSYVLKYPYGFQDFFQYLLNLRNEMFTNKFIVIGC